MVKRSREDSVSASDEASPISEVASPASAASPETPLHSTKYVELDSSIAIQGPTEAMRCSLPPHRQSISFTSHDAYEVHYAKAHVNRCSECRKNFPTEHFLGLHIEENHDPLNEIRKARGEKTYGCFVGDCDRKCSTPQKRKRHMIDKHMFPKDYDFYIVNDGIDKRNSMLRSRPGHRRRSSAAAQAAQIEQRARRRGSVTATSTAKETADSASKEQKEVPSMDVDEPESEEDSTTEKPNPNLEQAPNKVPLQHASKSPSSLDSAAQTDAAMASLTDSMSALKFVPPSIRFGRGRGKAGFSKH